MMKVENGKKRCDSGRCRLTRTNHTGNRSILRGTDDEAGKAIRIGLPGGDGGHQTPPPKHADRTGHIQHLTKLVGHQNDGSPGGPQIHEGSQKAVNFLGCQNSGGLIEGKNGTIATESLEDFQTLTLTNPQMSGHSRRIDGKAETLGQMMKRLVQP
jgi:hypothetical protein